ncbi:MAG: hypothetical protein JNJ88_02935 [Planctomycetes bacterium]|nr:hypothetical protein [Planctomycetota bacterium]
MPRSRKSAEEIASIPDDLQRSNLSLCAFARSHRIPYATLRYWSRRASCAIGPIRAAVRFVEAHHATKTASPTIVEIAIGAEITIRAAAHTDPDKLSRLVLALRARC